jgi:hypothetical protein
VPPIAAIPPTSDGSKRKGNGLVGSVNRGLDMGDGDVKRSNVMRPQGYCHPWHRSMAQAFTEAANPSLIESPP